MKDNTPLIVLISLCLIMFVVSLRIVGADFFVVGTVGLLLALSGILLVYSFHRSKHKSEQIDKGTKLLEVKAIMFGDKSYRKALFFMIILFLILVVIAASNWLMGENIETWQVFIWLWFPACTIPLFMMKTYEIYEDGIMIMVRFHPWNTFKGYKAKNGWITIYYKSHGRFVLPDEDGYIEKVIMQYLKPKQERVTTVKLGLKV